MNDSSKRWEEMAKQLLSLYESSQNDDSSVMERTVMNAFREAFAQVAAEARGASENENLQLNADRTRLISERDTMRTALHMIAGPVKRSSEDMKEIALLALKSTSKENP